MDFIQHPTCNDVLGAPKGVDISACRALPIRRVYYEEDGIHAVESFWKPSVEELALLNAGHPIVINMWGTTIPPVAVNVLATL